MKSATASRTAQYMALFRALETARPAGKKLFDDPYATVFLDKGLKRVCRLAAAFPLSQTVISSIIQRRIPGALGSGIARTKYIDDLLARCIRQGNRQVIILGAGFDTRSLRLELPDTVKVYEVDHPDTARLKIQRLQECLGALPSNTRYIQADLNTENPHAWQSSHSLDLSVPVAVIWEGVTNYLQPEAIAKTMAFFSRLAAGSHIIFTYVHQGALDRPETFYKAARLLRDLERIEERWTFGIDPSGLPSFLNKYGYTLIEDQGAGEYRGRYIPERKGLLHGYEFYRVAFAVKTDPPAILPL